MWKNFKENLQQQVVVGRNVISGLSVMVYLKKIHPKAEELFSLKHNKRKLASNMDKNLASAAEAKTVIDLILKIHQHLKVFQAGLIPT